MLLKTPSAEGDKIDKEKEYLFKVCEILFTRINIESECVETIKLFDAMGAQMLGQDPKEKEKESFGQRLKNLYFRIHAAPYSAKSPVMEILGNSLRGHLNRDFDPYRQGNPVHVLYQLKIGDKNVKALGMGTPTAEDVSGTVSLIPEFLGMLQSYKRGEKKYLYVSNQNTIKKGFLGMSWFGGDETNRSNVLLDLQDDNDYKHTYYAIALSKNSPFYFQKGDYKKLNDSNNFKKELYKQVFELGREESGCYIPKEIKDKIAKGDKNKARGIIEAIHKEVFKDEKELSVKERKEFILLFYDYLIKTILVDFDIDDFNVTCKDQIDRGAESNARFYGHALLLEDLISKDSLFSEEGSHAQRVASLMLSRALFVRKRAPINERFLGFLEGFEFGLEHRDKLKNLHQSIFPNLRFIPKGPPEKSSIDLPAFPQARLPNEEPQGALPLIVDQNLPAPSMFQWGVSKLSRFVPIPPSFKK